MKAVAAFALVMAAVLAACTKVEVESRARHSWTRAGVLRIAINEEPKNLNPLLAGTTPEIFIGRLMFEPLLSADPSGNPIPMLAAVVPSQANGGISPDGLTIRYHLRQARWTDGVPVTARDVIWSWQAIENGNNDVVSRHGYDDVRSIDAPDPRTVVVHLVRPFAPFVDTFFAESDQPYAVLPAHVLEKYPDINHVGFNAQPNVSDGPFRFVAWERGDRVLLDANPSFFLGAPRLRRIEVHFVPNEDSAINLMRTHAIDYFYQPSIQTYPALRALPDARTVWTEVNGFEGVALNLSHRILADAAVRAGIAAALDKSALARQITHGQMTVASEDLPSWIWAFDPSVRAVPFDPTAARAMLARAGWTPGADGVLQKDGRPLELLLAADASSATQRSESLLRSGRPAADRHRRGRQILPAGCALRAGWDGRNSTRREVRSRALHVVLRHRPGRFVAAHVREYPAARLQRRPVLQPGDGRGAGNGLIALRPCDAQARVRRDRTAPRG